MIVVDNSSTDGTRELVGVGFPQARVVRSPNRGFAYGNNRGLEHANARYMLLLNPDTEDRRRDLRRAGASSSTSDPTSAWSGVRQ